MIAAALFSWWYGQGWHIVYKNMQKRLRQTTQLFSVPILLQTLFSPWHRIVSYPGAGIDDHVRAMLDNLVSRAVGFTARFFVLIAAGVAVAAVIILAAIELAAWPLIPLAVLVGFIKGILS